MVTPPGILLHGVIALASNGSPVTTGVVEVVYTPSSMQAPVISISASLELIEVGLDTYSFELRVPSAPELPGYPVDKTSFLAIPEVPVVYTRTFYLDGVRLLIDESSSGMTNTVTLKPADVRASYETLSLILDNVPPIADPLSISTPQNTPVAIPLSGRDNTTQTLTFRTISEPRNGILSGTVPNIIYTPNNGFLGIDIFEYVVNDGVNDSPPARVQVTVFDDNQPPTAISQNLTTNEDTPLPITLSGTDDEEVMLVYTLRSQPINGTVSGNPPNLLYSPNLNFNGSDSLSFSVNDGTFESNTASVSLEILPINDPPVAQTLSFEGPQNEPITVELQGSDIETLSLNYLIANQPTNGMLSGDAPNLIYTPNLDFSGEDSFEYVVSDGELNSEPALVSITIIDSESPSAILSIPDDTSTNSEFELQVKFSEVVFGLELSDFQIQNAALQNLVQDSADPTLYTLLVLPQTDGVVTISLPENQVTDAEGNFNVASNVVNFTFRKIRSFWIF